MESPKIKSATSPTELRDKKPNMKEMTKAERRALQEKQRAEKESQKNKAGTNTSKDNKQPKENKPKQEAVKQVQQSKSQPGKSVEVSNGINMFSHLQLKQNQVNPKDIHQSIIDLARLYASYVICGSNARCIAMLNAFKIVINDYISPPNTTMCRQLNAHLSPYITYLVAASKRPLSTTMGHAIRFLKREISTLDPDLDDETAKQTLVQTIDTFINQNITVADQLIATTALSKINNNDVILTYGGSSTIRQLLLNAHRQNLKFRVIVVDAGPRHEVAAGLTCTYIQLSAISYIMTEVTKVFLGAHTMFSNGALLSRAGTALVALAGYEAKLPVIVCCGTYKFSEKVQLDAIVTNELGDPSELIGDDTGNNLFALNLQYDLTPSMYISVVICEVGMIPCTSVPVVLREYGPHLQ